MKRQIKKNDQDVKELERESRLLRTGQHPAYQEIHKDLERTSRRLHRNTKGSAGAAIIAGSIGAGLGALGGAVAGLCVGVLAQASVNASWHFNLHGIESAVALGALALGLIYGTIGTIAGALSHNGSVNINVLGLKLRF